MQMCIVVDIILSTVTMLKDLVNNDVFIFQICKLPEESFQRPLLLWKGNHTSV